MAVETADGDGGDAGAPTGFDDWSDPCRVAEARQQLRDIARELGRLPARSRAAFVMRHVEGREIAEICAELAMTPGHLSVLLHRARRNLERNLGAGVAPEVAPARLTRPAVEPAFVRQSAR